MVYKTSCATVLQDYLLTWHKRACLLIRMDGSGEDGIRALKAAIAGHFGSQVKTARAVGVTPQAVSEVVRRGKRVPAEWCLKLERASGGLLTAQALRPDLYPADQSRQVDQWMTCG